MITPQCIITGANFIDVAEDKFIHGDLHSFGDVYIFNAAGCEWEYGKISEKFRNIYYIYCANYFEKNKIIVFYKMQSSLNTAARIYLGVDAP